MVVTLHHPRIQHQAIHAERVPVALGLIEIRIGATTFSIVLLILSTDMRFGFCAQSFAAP